MNMDYALSEVLATMAGIQVLLVMYDIMCQYGINLMKRFGESEYLHMPPNVEIRRGIGLFHVHGHQDTCFPRYSPNFIPGAGQIDGEVIETLWAPLNLISGSTRGMTTAHRKEVIDDHMNDSNWKKLTGMGGPTLTLVERLIDCGFNSEHPC